MSVLFFGVCFSVCCGDVARQGVAETYRKSLKKKHERLLFVLLSLVSVSLGQNVVTKTFTYRAQKNVVDLSVPCTALKYGFANMTLSGDFSQGGSVALTGNITGFVNETTTGEKWVLAVTAELVPSSADPQIPFFFRASANGPVNGLMWQYQYVGVGVGPWTKYSSPEQQQFTLVGSVVRLVGHGKAPAGEAASFYAVEHPAENKRRS